MAAYDSRAKSPGTLFLTVHETEGATFLMAHDKGSTHFSDLHFHDCTFDNCSLSMMKHPQRMSRVRNMRLSKCRAVNSMIQPCLFEDVLIEDLSTNPILLVWTSFFRRVKLAGKIGKLNLNLTPSARTRAFLSPSRRRDPHTQVIVDKQGRYPGYQALGADFSKAFPGIASVLQGFDESPRQSILLTASLAAPKARRDEEKGAIAELRTLGFMEEGAAPSGA